MDYLEKFFKKTGWMSVLVSAIFAVLGIILIYNPDGIIKVISYILGVIFIGIGLYKVISYFQSKGKYDLYNHNLIYGILAIIIGVVTIIYSSTIGTILRIVIGIWIIYSSLIRISTAFKLKRLNTNVWIYSMVLAVIMLSCGLYILINSGAVIVTVGIIMLVYSIIDIIEGIIFMRNVKEIF